MQVPTFLNHLPVGGQAIVRRILAPRGIARRLMEMGLVPGTAVAVGRRAPLGDPIELHLRGYVLSIRRSEATLVEVE